MVPVPTSADLRTSLEGRCAEKQSLKRKPSGTANDENVDPPRGRGQLQGKDMAHSAGSLDGTGLGSF